MGVKQDWGNYHARPFNPKEPYRDAPKVRINDWVPVMTPDGPGYIVHCYGWNVATGYASYQVRLQESGLVNPYGEAVLRIIDPADALSAADRREDMGKKAQPAKELKKWELLGIKITAALDMPLPEPLSKTYQSHTLETLLDLQQTSPAVLDEIKLRIAKIRQILAEPQ